VVAVFSGLFVQAPAAVASSAAALVAAAGSGYCGLGPRRKEPPPRKASDYHLLLVCVTLIANCATRLRHKRSLRLPSVRISLHDLARSDDANDGIASDFFERNKLRRGPGATCFRKVLTVRGPSRCNFQLEFMFPIQLAHGDFVGTETVKLPLDPRLTGGYGQLHV
jgi:hypothetical protein